MLNCFSFTENMYGTRNKIKTRKDLHKFHKNITYPILLYTIIKKLDLKTFRLLFWDVIACYLLDFRDFNGFRIYPMSRGKFGRLKLLVCSSCVGPFCPKISDLVPLQASEVSRTDEKQPSPTYSRGGQENE